MPGALAGPGAAAVAEESRAGDWREAAAIIRSRSRSPFDIPIEFTWYLAVPACERTTMSDDGESIIRTSVAAVGAEAQRAHAHVSSADRGRRFFFVDCDAFALCALFAGVCASTGGGAPLRFRRLGDDAECTGVRTGVWGGAGGESAAPGSGVGIGAASTGVTGRDTEIWTFGGSKASQSA